MGISDHGCDSNRILFAPFGLLESEEEASEVFRKALIRLRLMSFAVLEVYVSLLNPRRFVKVRELATQVFFRSCTPRCPIADSGAADGGAKRRPPVPLRMHRLTEVRRQQKHGTGKHDANQARRHEARSPF